MDIYEGLVLPDIVDAADILRPVYDRTDGIDGYVSLEVNPELAYDTEGTIAEARRLFAQVNRPNVFIKVPATAAGLPAIETLIGEGINVNVTLIFALSMYDKVMKAYVTGLERIVACGGEPSKVASVASFFVSRVDTLVDKLLMEKHPPHTDISDLLGAAAIANARLAYPRFERAFDPNGEFAGLAAKGARPQRPVWASTSTKNPDYPPTKYVDGLVGGNTVNTIPPETIDAVLHEGATQVTITEDISGAHAVIEQLEKLGIHMEAVTDKLRVDGVDLFAKSFDDLLANLSQKQAQLGAVG
jgi:transaldolase/glucose-6-phosphate isomerase